LHQRRWHEAALAFTSYAELDRRPLDAVRSLFVELGRAAALDEVIGFGGKLIEQLTEGGDRLRSLLAQLDNSPDRERLAMRLDQLSQVHQRLFNDTSAFVAAIAPRPLRLDLIDLRQVLEACLSIAAASLERIDVVTAHGTRAGELVADERLLRKALLNIILHAADAAGIDGELWIATTDGDGMVIIVVEDSGPSLDERTSHELFDIRSERGELALIQSASIIARHGGHISLECPRDRGARFVIALPTILPASVELNSRELLMPIFEPINELLIDSA
jgi:signal transduction histidine kinase